MKENYLVCEVEDNGIGRKKSEELKSPLKKSQKSKGIEITEKRLRAMKPLMKKPVEIIDKTDENHLPCGTLAIIKIVVEQN